MEWFREQFYQTFIQDGRWYIYFAKGLGTTLKVTLGALLVGVVIGVCIAVIRSAYDSQRVHWRGLGGVLLGIGNLISKIYLTVIRGTPSTVQLLIIYFILFGSSQNMVLAAIISFGVNSGAYVAEIVRSGIMSINKGQMEAGRSLGLNYAKTMQFIIIPQAIKNILPALGNELITLLKETSICTVIGLMDLTKGAMIVQSRTYAPWMPYLSIAVIYLVMVMILTKLLGMLERRLRASDRR
ncbi:amino acid ABC transporter permease [Agathobaculum sp. NTUH-O15-33]|uniref:amino acid ABC transporter permease n=1 Tax=Agathobaculum sp. NTUH-O15-33 TaxID=3079302 RepID=UPI002958AA57|nr:amino acid ABC transporter permease [Agathobaculum sp. NTUH-O15-33]WNX83424.1 amino acid ABC transporter permease [Agathobaculum sp. NTUH-O15-33]